MGLGGHVPTQLPKIAMLAFYCVVYVREIGHNFEAQYSRCKSAPFAELFFGLHLGLPPEIHPICVPTQSRRSGYATDENQVLNISEMYPCVPVW